MTTKKRKRVIRLSDHREAFVNRDGLVILDARNRSSIALDSNDLSDLIDLKANPYETENYDAE